MTNSRVPADSEADELENQIFALEDELSDEQYAEYRRKVLKLLQESK